MCWWYYFCKFTEFLDTIFFVLRKKFDQITNLHVIHHSIMPAAVWWGVKFTPGGHATFFGMLNTFVHIIMYTYYLLAAMGPKYQKYLWWKKHLTTMQMIQFIAVFIHSAQLFFIDCNFPKVLAYAMCFNALMFLSLFSNFYIQVRNRKYYAGILCQSIGLFKYKYIFCFIQAYIKRRRLPAIKKDDDSEKKAVTDRNGNLNVANGHSKDKVTSHNAEKGVGKMFTNIMSNTSNACYIGQNGLYQSNGKAKSNGSSSTQKKNM